MGGASGVRTHGSPDSAQAAAKALGEQKENRNKVNRTSVVLVVPRQNVGGPRGSATENRWSSWFRDETEIDRPYPCCPCTKAQMGVTHTGDAIAVDAEDVKPTSRKCHR
ncbi:hypothetical protein P7K49_040618 [Saguinus oedipus]|uniref:Uncharacterized protein n=1 Tax=Saguinus oedipus TaxID=9490 RepID=A0ABQ9T9D2_SAGOE|nr:hypothetical protein P7K49_040618 [Saguinus oedipus]